MSFTRTTSHLALAMAAVFAISPAFAADAAAPDAAAMWTHYIAHGDFEKVGELTAFDEVEYDGDAVDAAKCREHADSVRTLVAQLPVSLAVRRLAYLCADATGDTALAGQELDVLAALSRHALQQAGDPGVSPPIRVLLPADAYALLRNSGWDVGYEYFAQLWPSGFFPHVVVAWDEESQTERHLAFDYVGTAYDLSRGADYPYPILRTWLANGFVRGSAESDGLAAVDLSAVQAARIVGYADRVAKLRGATARGGLQSAKSWLLLCALQKAEHCSEGLVDNLLTLSEERDALPMALLAYAYVAGVGTQADPQSGWSLLDAAQQRWTGALVEFADLWVSAHARTEPFPQALQQRLDHARAAGNRAVERLLIKRRLGTEGAKISEGDIAFLSAPDQNALGRGYAALAAYYRSAGDAAAAREWTGKAAQAGDPDNQAYLAGALQYGWDEKIPRDPAQAGRLAAQAAHGGSSAAALQMSYRSALEGDFKAVEGWLLAPAAQPEGNSLLMLADLYREERPGVSEKAPRAAELYQSLVETKEYGAKARRGLALMAMAGQGMPKDPARARDWLLADAKAGDVESQEMLGQAYLKGELGAPDEAEGLRWLQRAIDAGSEDALTEYASWLYYDRNTPQSRTQGLAMLAEAVGKGNRSATNNYAWLLCSSPLPDVYDPRRGNEVISKLSDADRDSPGTMDTVAACHAANGDFAAAVKLQEVAARQLAALQSPQDVAKLAGKPAGFTKRLELYKAGKRYEEYERNQ